MRISGIDPNNGDIYFFSVQQNPLGGETRVAIFPLTHPPFACIMLAFSRDGLNFSWPITLRVSPLGVRPGDSDATTLEWRAEDHPVAGIVRASNDSTSLLFYVHHAVRIEHVCTKVAHLVCRM